MKQQYTDRQPATGLKRLALAALLACTGTAAQAQALNYPAGNVQNVPGTYTDLGTAGTVITTSSTDDANSAEQQIGFSFSYNGSSMDRFMLNTNGFLKLGTAGMTAPAANLYTVFAQFNSSGTLLSTGASNVNLLSPFNFDLISGSSAAEYRMATTGATGTRICTIQWKNVADKAIAAASGGGVVENQYANLSFQVKLYEVNGAIEFVYGPTTPAPAGNNNFKYAQTGIKGSGNAANQVVRMVKGSTVAWGDAATAAGPVTAGATGAFNFRQAVPADNGRTFRFVPTLANDAAVGTLYTITKLVVPNAAPHTVQALVRNGGTNALNNVAVTLNVTGANTFTDVQTVASLAAGASTTVTFAGYTPTSQGTNTVTVSVPADDNPYNNSLATDQLVNPTTFSYSTLNAGATSATGFPEDSELGFAAKYSLANASTITGVSAFIFDASPVPGSQKSTVGETLYGVVLNPTTGALLGRSADFIVGPTDVGRMHTFVLTTPLAASAGDIMVGMVQVSPLTGSGESFFPMGVQTENPTRSGTFYRFAPGTAPFDISTGTTVSTNRYMLDAIISPPPAACAAPTAIAVTGTSTTASVAFTGNTAGTGYQIVYGATGFNPASAGTTTATFTAGPGAVTGLTASTCYDFYVRTVCGTTGQSTLAGPINFCTPCVAPTISTFPYAQNFDAVAAGQALPCGITVTDSNNDGFTWRARATVDVSLATGNISRSAPNAMVYSYNNVGPTPTIGGDDWFFTPALTLSNTQRYRVSFYYRGASASGYSERLEVKYGAAATPAGQTTTLYTNNNITATTYQLASNASTPAVADIVPTNGTFYVGFHAISLANQGFLAIDDLTIVASPLATSEALKRAVSVFPNPSNSGQFNLEIHGANAAQLTVEVTNLLGQRVYSGTAKDNLRTVVDLSALTSGIYSLKVRNGQEFTMQQSSIVK